MPQPIPWVFYVSEMGRPVVQREIDKMQLDLEEYFELEEIMARISSQTEKWKDTDYLGNEIWEARIRVPRRQIRVLFTKEPSPRVLLALLAAVKKVQKTPPQWISLARRRQKDWLLRLEDDE